MKRKKWIKIAPLNVARCTASSTVYKNRIYIFGGFIGKGRTAEIECYDRVIN